MKKLIFIGLIICMIGCKKNRDSVASENSVEEVSEEMAPKDTLVLLSTSFGDIKLKLYDETPLHKANFLKLVEEGYYDSLLFHRVMRDFMIQGGDPKSKTAAPGQRLGMGSPGYTIPAEFNPIRHHKKGALAAARTGNPEKASSGSQFYIVEGRETASASLDLREQKISKSLYEGFKYTEQQREDYINLGGTPHLDMDYTVFGEVVEGLNIVDSISMVRVDRYKRPIEDQQMFMKIIIE